MDQTQQVQAQKASPAISSQKTGMADSTQQSKYNPGVSVQKNPASNQVMQQPMKKHSLWWLWMLIGLVVGFLGSWAYFGFSN